MMQFYFAELSEILSSGKRTVPNLRSKLRSPRTLPDIQRVLDVLSESPGSRAFRHGFDSTQGSTLLLFLRSSFLGTASGQIPAPAVRVMQKKYYAASAFSVSPGRRGSLPEFSRLRLGSGGLSLWGVPENGADKDTYESWS
jgi:hypothetical protein